MCLLYNYGQVIYSMKDQFLPVKMRCDVELWGKVVCVERRSNRVNWRTLEIAPFSTRYTILLFVIPVTMKYTVQPSNGVLNVQWRSNKVIINVSIFKHVTMCLSMYARQHRMPLENLLHPRQMGYYIGLFLSSCNYIVTRNVFAKWTICFSFLFVKYSLITKYCVLSQFGNVTWNVLPMFIFRSLSSSSPSRRLSLSIAKVIFHE